MEQMEKMIHRTLKSHFSEQYQLSWVILYYPVKLLYKRSQAKSFLANEGSQI